MIDVIQPDSEQVIVEVVAAASAAGRPIEIVGHGSKSGFGRPVSAQTRLVLAGLSGITDYEPGELVLTARAGTPLAEIDGRLAQNRQTLAFEPRELSALFGTTVGQTLGGVVAAGIPGPRRCVGGGVRDHVLGVRAVNGRGQLFKAGGKVVKNVTGYDLCKLFTGSFGTLAVLTEITIKILPAAETETTVVISGLTAAAAVSLMSEALGSAANPSAAAWLPAGLTTGTTLAGIAAGSATCLRLEGFGPSVQARCQRLLDRSAGGPDATVLGNEASVTLWRRLRDVRPFHDRPGQAVWKISLRPSDAPALLDRLTALGPVDAFLDWGGALIWVSAPCGADAHARNLRTALPPGAHATLVVAPEPVRAAQAVFQPLPAAVSALEARVKASFDPQGILNPGRMAAVLSAD